MNVPLESSEKGKNGLETRTDSAVSLALFLDKA